MRYRRDKEFAAARMKAEDMTKRTGSDLIAANVHDKLRRRIITLELKPGSRLVEEEVSATMNVGRTPVREALLRLQGEGLVSRDRGWIVQAGNIANMSAVFESRIAIEGYATRLASQRVKPKDLEELEALVLSMDEEQPRSQLNRSDRRFHVQIVALSGNPMLVEMHQRTQFHYWNLRLPVVFGREQAQRSNEQHKSILEALRNADADAAERTARIHIETTFGIVREALEDV
jgi:DNA-binding GntR family transcriptional regulator